MNQKTDFYITSLLKLMYDTFKSLPKLFVDKMIKKLMNFRIKVMDQLSKFIKWNKYNQQMEPMYISREELMNILSCVDFAKLCHIINNFPELNCNIMKEGNIPPLLYSSRAIKHKKKTNYKHVRKN